MQEIQKTNKQHAVPQNIMDVEFRIIGDLTMRQFMYLIVFGGVAYGSFTALVGNIFRWPITVLSAISGVALAFVPLEERGLDEWLVNFFKAVYSPTQRIWKKDVKVPTAFLYQNMSVMRQELITLAPTSSRRKLEEYLTTQGQRETIDPYDIPERDFVEKVHNAFMLDVQTRTTVTTEEPQVSAPLMPPLRPLQEESKEEIEPASKKETAQKETYERPKEPSEVKEVKPPKAPEFKLPRQQKKVTLAPLTPDRHSGRRFTSFLPAEGEIILPIRGERVIKTDEEDQIDEDINEKMKQLQILLDQIKKDDSYKGIIDQKDKTKTEEVNKEVKDVAEKLKDENAKLSQEIEALKAKLSTPQQDETSKAQTEQQIQKLEKEKQVAAESYEQLQNKIKELEDKLSTRDRNLPKVIVQKVFEKPNFLQKAEEKKPVEAKPAGIQALSNTPNVIAGVVKGAKGEIIPGAVVIIKNDKDEPARALKTNVLGQFSISTPLTNGTYIVEVDKYKNTGYTFDIIKVEVKGEVIPMIEFVGKTE